MSTLRTAEPRLRRLLDAVADLEQLPRFAYRGDEFTPGELLEALVLTESSGDPEARRYEPAQDLPGRPDTSRDPDTLAQDDGPVEDDASYGLTQVMGTTFKALLKADRPVKLDYRILYRPLFGLAAGIEVLKHELAAVYVAHPGESDSERLVRALCRYNGGSTGDAMVNGDLRRREYVDRIHANAQRVRSDRAACGWKAA